MASRLHLSLLAKYSAVSKSCRVGFFHNLSNKLETTTDTELIAIAALAIHGASIKPTRLKTPAAKGIPTKKEYQFRCSL